MQDDDPAAARNSLDLVSSNRTVALLPGSRNSEVSRLAEPMIEAARILEREAPECNGSPPWRTTTSDKSSSMR